MVTTVGYVPLARPFFLGGITMNPAKIARDGVEALDIDTLARRVHCRATVYRYVGGKLEIRDAVLARAAHRIVDSVRDVVADLTGAERVVTAISEALERIRSDPLGQLLIKSIRGAQGTAWLASSPLLAGFATDPDRIGRPRPGRRAVGRSRGAVFVVLAQRRWPIRTAAAGTVRRASLSGAWRTVTRSPGLGVFEIGHDRIGQSSTGRVEIGVGTQLPF